MRLLQQICVHCKKVHIITYSVLTGSEMYFSSPCCAAAAIFQHSAAVLSSASSSNLAWVCVRGGRSLADTAAVRVVSSDNVSSSYGGHSYWQGVADR